MDNTRLYREIFEPEIVASAPRFADRTMMKTRNSEIRAYGTKVYQHENGSRNVYFTMMYSRDNAIGKETGLSYLHFQTASETPDPHGVFIHAMQMQMSIS